METITDQVKYLRRAVEHAMEASKQTGAGPRAAAAADGDGDGDQLQLEELQEQVRVGGRGEAGEFVVFGLGGGAGGVAVGGRSVTGYRCERMVETGWR